MPPSNIKETTLSVVYKGQSLLMVLEAKRSRIHVRPKLSVVAGSKPSTEAFNEPRVIEA